MWGRGSISADVDRPVFGQAVLCNCSCAGVSMCMSLRHQQLRCLPVGAVQDGARYRPCRYSCLCVLDSYAGTIVHGSGAAAALVVVAGFAAGLSACKRPVPAVLCCFGRSATKLAGGNGTSADTAALAVVVAASAALLGSIDFCQKRSARSMV